MRGSHGGGPSFRLEAPRRFSMSRSPGVGGASPRDAWGEGLPDGRGHDLAAILPPGVLLAQGPAFITESSQTGDEAARASGRGKGRTPPR